MYVDIDDLSGFFAEYETSMFFQQQTGKNTINDPKFRMNAFLTAKNHDDPHSEFMTFALPRPLPVLLTPIWLAKPVEAELILFLQTAAYSWAGRWHFLLRFGHRSY